MNEKPCNFLKNKLAVISKQQIEIERLSELKSYVNKLELSKINHKIESKKLRKLAKMIEINNLPTPLDLLEMLSKLINRCSKCSKTSKMVNYSISKHIEKSEFSYAIECVEKTYEYYEEAGIRIDKYYLSICYDFIDFISKILRKFHRFYKKYCAAGLFTTIRGDIDFFIEIYKEFYNIVARDRKNIEQTII